MPILFRDLLRDDFAQFSTDALLDFLHRFNGHLKRRCNVGRLLAGEQSIKYFDAPRFVRLSQRFKSPPKMMLAPMAVPQVSRRVMIA